MSELCRHCNENPATGNLRWYAATLYFVLGSLGTSGPYCEDCAGGRSFVALLFIVIALLVAFVLGVIFW